MKGNKTFGLWILLGLTLLVVLTALAVGSVYNAGRNDADAKYEHTLALGDTEKQDADDNPLTVTLSRQVQERSGIVVQPLLVSKQGDTTTTYGTALDLQPLIELRTRAAIAGAEVEAAMAALQASKEEYERVRRLHGDDGNMSLKALQAARAALAADKAKTMQAESVLQTVQATASYQFGPVLARWALSLEAVALQPFLDLKAVVVRIAMPSLGDENAPQTIQIGLDGAARHDATLIGLSPEADPLLSGRAYLYRSFAALPTSTRITAWLPTVKPAGEATLIPESAVVWYGGQPWAFLQTADETFERRPIPVDHVLSDAGYVVATGFSKGDYVVTTGAQLLLSEEFRASIQSEDGDD